MLPTAAPPREPPAAGARLERSHAGASLRVGYLSDALPYAFVNGRDELVGFDVALMHRLAHRARRPAGVRADRAPALDQPAGVAALLRDGYCDIVIGGMAVTTARAD